MTSSIFRRDPRGRFIWEGDALSVWLPELLRTCATGRAAERALDGVAAFCDRQAATKFKAAAMACEQRLVRQPPPSEYIAAGNEWLRKSAVIRRAKKEIEGVPF